MIFILLLFQLYFFLIFNMEEYQSYTFSRYLTATAPKLFFNYLGQMSPVSNFKLYYLSSSYFTLN